MVMFPFQIQGHLKAAIATVIGPDVHERDVGIVSVSEDMQVRAMGHSNLFLFACIFGNSSRQGTSEGKGMPFDSPCIAVTISIKAPRQGKFLQPDLVS